jgi:hypothetical protein
MCCTQSQVFARRCSVDQSQLTQCLYSATAFSAGCPVDPSPGSYGYVFVVQQGCPNGCVVTDAGADANDYCRD